MNLFAVLALAAADLNGQSLPDVVLLDFTASYCQPCQQMVPVLQRMENHGFPIRRIDITKQPQVSRQYKVDRIPTLILLVEGQEAKRFVGLTAEAELRREMNDAARRLDMERRAAGAPPRTAQTASADQPPKPEKAETRPGLRGIFDRMRQGLGGEKVADKDKAEHPDFRAQSPGPVTGATPNDSAAMQATVRVRLDDGEFRDVGTGTVVHSTSGQSIVLTCAHIFKDAGPESETAVIVDVFRNGETLKYPATVIGGDHASDIAFLRIQNKSPLPMVSLASKPATAGESVFSIGCNGGNMPTILNSRVVQVNRYEGPENIVCSVDPVQGRSGGGLFNAAGELIGVCSGAFRERKEGLYTGFGAVHKLMSQLKLNSLFEDSAPVFEEIADASEAVASETKNPFENADEIFDELFSEDGTELADAEEFRSDSPAATAASKNLPDPFAPASAQLTTTPAAGNTEITVIIDSKDPAKGKKVVVIPKPSPWLMELLTGEPAANKPGLATTRTQEVSTTSARRKTQKISAAVPLPPARW